MTFATQLLRILLIVVLVTSGPGMAAPHLAMPMASSHSVAADRGCHDHAGMAHATPGNDDGMHAQHPGRCSSADCHCACAHLLQALSAACAPLPIVAAQRTHAILPAAHPDAVLAHLIRPPIG